MAIFITKLFRFFRGGLAIGMGILILYCWCAFLTSVKEGSMIMTYQVGETNVLPFIHMGVTLVLFNVVVMFLFSPKGSTVCLALFTLIWNSYLWFQVYETTWLSPELFESAQLLCLDILQINCLVSLILVLSCGLLELNSRITSFGTYY